jgi:hypothetical protein
MQLRATYVIEFLLSCCIKNGEHDAEEKSNMRKILVPKPCQWLLCRDLDANLKIAMLTNDGLLEAVA